MFKVKITDPEAIELIEFESILAYLDESPYWESKGLYFINSDIKDVFLYNGTEKLKKKAEGKAYWDGNTPVRLQFLVPGKKVRDYLPIWKEIIAQLACSEHRSQLEVWSDLTGIEVKFDGVKGKDNE